MSTINVKLTEHFTEFVHAQVASGQYNDTNEVLCAGLRLLERQAAKDREKLALLKALAEEGFRQLDQGQGIEFRDRKELRKLIRRARKATPVRRGEA